MTCIGWAAKRNTLGATKRSNFIMAKLKRLSQFRLTFETQGYKVGTGSKDF